jgi:DNA-binding response OmpR family regulator/signal transduction histidine kinase
LLKFKKRFVFLLVFVVGVSFSIFISRGIYGEIKNDEGKGIKYLTNYSPDDYKHPPQNWWLAQDHRGIIYSANHGGLLEYDGISWRAHNIIPNISVRCIAIDSSCTIYMGGYNEFGYLEPDINGSFKYVSLLGHIDDNKKDFSAVWGAHATVDGIYFLTSKYLFRWSPSQNQMKVWKSEAPRFNISFTCGGKFFVHQRTIGLMHVKDNALELIPGIEKFAHVKIFMMDRFDREGKKLLIGTRSKGFYIYDEKEAGKEAVPFPTEADHYLEEQKICHGIRLSNGEFALATRQGGVVIIDSRGKLKEIFTRASGLQDDNVKYVYEDSRGILWLALAKGISKIEYNSPLSVFDERTGLTGLVTGVLRHRNRLYAGTTNGLYILASNNRFHPVTSITGNCWSLLSIGDVVLAATVYGVFQVNDVNNFIKAITGKPSFVLNRSQKDPNRVWVGTQQGLTALYSKNGKWTKEYKFENITEAILSIVEDQQGNLWLGTNVGKVLRIDFSNPGSVAHVYEGGNVTRFDESHGLAPGYACVSMAAGHMVVASGRGLLRWVGESIGGRFVPDFTLGKEFVDGSRNVYYISEDKNKHIWFHSNLMNFQAAPRPDGTYKIIDTPFKRIPLVQVDAIYPDPNGEIVWFASNKGLLRYDTGVKKNYNLEFRALVRKVQRIDDKSVIFDGYRRGGESKHTGSSFPIPVFSNKDNNIRFKFAATFFEDESRIEYSFFLEGYDDHWSEWTGEAKKDYTNLDAGFYIFRVRAKNVYGHLSREDVFHFKVLPPWYKTWWAYLVYIFLLFMGVYLIVKWRSIKLEQEKQHLEKIVKERTKEINEKNRQLELQTLQLQDQSEKLKEMDRIKSRFFANISHEFRTPLTLIMGPLEKRLSLCRDKQDIQEIQMMLRNSRRLLNLVNQLLELARLESGKMKLEASGQNIVPFVKNIVMCFESLAAQNKTNLFFQKQKENIMVYFDPEKLENIITNLLSNAFKYTPANGKVMVSVRKAAETGRFLFGCVEISVRDTGFGIPSDQLSHIFDRFYRVEGGHEHKQKGSGIGLALTKELVDLHYGEINVQSSCRDDESRGSEFILRLPLGKEHLQPEEMVETAEPEDSIDKPTARRAIKSFDQTFSKVWPPAGLPEAIGLSKEIEEVKETADAEQEEKPLILVVDDNTDVRTYIRGSLGPYFKMVEAVDGKEGILRAREIIPDLIVSDVMMPEVDGYELCRTLKNDVLTSHVPIILLTAKVSEESELQGLETGADDYIAKPFSTELLAVRVRNLIDLRRQLQLEKKNRMTFQPGEISVSPLDDEFYNKLQDTIEMHLSDPDFSVEALCRVLDMSQATLYRKIHALTGKSPTLFLRSFRMKRAAQLLQANAGSVSDVAVKVGFPDKSYFARCFKEQFHCLPSDISGTVEATETNEKFFGGSRGAVFQKSSPGPGRQDIILVVEDSEDTRTYIRQSLEPDYHVVEAVDGSEGTARAMEIIPDLVISDIMMPGMDGYELCRVLKQDVRSCHIPIVLLTAKAAEESKIKGLELGADDYITKPFNTRILRARIKNLIQLRTHLQEKRNREMTLLPVKITEPEIDREFMKELNAVIEENLEDPDFNVEQLAKKLYMSSATLYRKIQALSGEIPSEYIRSYRLRRAAQLFKENFGSVTEVAFEVGFNSRTYFTKCFKEKFHQLPSVYMANE